MASIDIYRDMLRTALVSGIPVISTDTAARILAVVYVHGNNEALAYSPKLKADLAYIQKRFGIYGTGKADTYLAAMTGKYSEELENYKSSDPNRGGALFRDEKPQWAVKLFAERYGIKLIN